ncbi:DUF1499 domain-containing protein [Paracraurococcus ruber]|uniref:DUF1499 domain-containing protein n=1 Tax=Paracraurococcus ruber TaxID=77675 RepID=A0ABS1D3Z5_9PROT|nr:DUF1499 domain-containing protein [Paracraurococcus ruber]MBK1661572.1 hypothetical protein [Paracraurococcus ruber]TDG18952.1 DUF1499 domain-containing protein [Paracraurococcus ruber]
MSAPIAALFASGTGGLPPAEPVDFATLRLPASPNTCLAAPPGGHPQAHVTVPPFEVAPDAAWAALLATCDAQPRAFRYGQWPERRQAQWVARSPLMNWPDIVAAEIVPAPGGCGLFLFSRSLFGYSDLGANRKRVEAWLAALGAALRR